MAAIRPQSGRISAGLRPSERGNEVPLRQIAIVPQTGAGHGPEVVSQVTSVSSLMRGHNSQHSLKSRPCTRCSPPRGSIVAVSQVATNALSNSVTGRPRRCVTRGYRQGRRARIWIAGLRPIQAFSRPIGHGRSRGFCISRASQPTPDAGDLARLTTNGINGTNHTVRKNRILQTIATIATIATT